MNKKFLAGSLLVASLIGGSAQVAGADVGVTVTNGGRTVSATNLDLPSVASESVARWTVGTITMTAESLSEANAWTATIQASALTKPDSDGTGPDTAASIPAQNLAVQYIGAITEVGAEEGATGPSVGYAESWTLNNALPIMTAEAGSGIGTWKTDLGLILEVPAYTPAGNYSTELTLSITAAP